MTLLVATVSGPEALEALIDVPHAARPCDWVEVRFDKITRELWPRTLRAVDAIMASGTHVLATVRWSAEGGDWPSDDPARLDAYAELLTHVHAVDIELASAYADELIARAHAASVKVILSMHDFEATPSRELLDARIEAGLALGADIVKIAAKANGPEDYPRLVQILADHPRGRVCLLGMGAYGVALRAFLPAAGSALAYGYLDVPAAPGQLSAESLAELLIRFIPGYHPGVRA